MVTLILRNNYVTIKGAPRSLIRDINSVTSYKVAGSQFAKSFKKGWWDGRKRLLKFSNKHGYRCPAGLLCDIIHLFDKEKVEYEIKNLKTKPKKLRKAYGWNDKIKLRPYQVDAIKAATSRKGTRPKARGILVMPIRSGKTITAAGIIRKLRAKALFVVPSQLLLHQTKEALENALMTDVGMIGDSHWYEHNITVATVQSLSRAKKKGDSKYKLMKKQYPLLIFDECFPAGTMVGDKPIEKIKIGEYIDSYDEKNKTFSKQQVIHVFKNKCKELLTVKLNDGREITCTPNHPFLTNTGWTPAIKLNNTMELCERMENEKIGLRNDQMLHVQERNIDKWRSKKPMEKNKQSLLFKRLFKRISTSSIVQNDEKNELETLKNNIGTNEKNKSDEQIGNKKKSFTNVEKNKTRSSHPRRKWKRRNTATTNVKRTSWARLGIRIRHKNKRTNNTTKIQTASLQNRHSKFNFENSHRSGRAQSLSHQGEKRRHSKREILNWIGVESVEIHKPRSDGKFESLCPDGFVYNLEVANTHTYTTQGIIVHNCHHLVADTWINLAFDMDAPYTIGLSATAEFEDDKQNELGVIWLRAICGDILYKISPSTLIEQGYLQRPIVQLYKVSSPDMFGRSWSSELANECIYQNSTRNSMIAKITKERLDAGDNVLIVTNRLNQVHEISRLLDTMDIEHWEITGRNTVVERRERIQSFKDGEVNVIVGTVFGEGIDIPEIVCVINAEGGADVKATKQRMRNLTAHENKRQAIFVDFMDMTNHYFAQHSAERLKVYKSEASFVLKVKKLTGFNEENKNVPADKKKTNANWVKAIKRIKGPKVHPMIANMASEAQKGRDV